MIVRNFIRNDMKEVFELWNTSFGDKWIIDFEFLEKIILDNDTGNSHFIIEMDGRISGFLATGKGTNSVLHGSIVLIMVNKEERRKGIGRKLLSIGEKYLKSLGVKEIKLGSGSNSYFWPGIPEDLSGAVLFFEKCGWDYYERSVDLLGDLRNFNPHSSVPINREIQITEANQKDMNKLLDFELTYFRHWYLYYKIFSQQADLSDILLAKDKKGNIVGSVLLFGPFNGKFEHSFRWKRILSDQMGGFGALGVKEELREQGIGMAIALKATEGLKRRGVIHSYLGWTWLTEWYGKIGYKEWRSYKMCCKKTRE